MQTENRKTFSQRRQFPFWKGQNKNYFDANCSTELNKSKMFDCTSSSSSVEEDEEEIAKKNRMNDGKNFSHTISQQKHPSNAFRLAEKHQFMVVGIVDVSDDRQNVLHMFSTNRRWEINIFNAYEINCIPFYQISTSEMSNMCEHLVEYISIRHEMNWKWRHRYQCQSVVCRISLNN